MTLAEANAEAKRLYGPDACATENERTPKCAIAGQGGVGLGQGATWEQAFAHAAQAEYLRTHPINALWEWSATERLRLMLRCRFCNNRVAYWTFHITRPLPPDRLARAEQYERMALALLASDYEWRGCSHRSMPVAADRRALISDRLDT